MEQSRVRVSAAAVRVCLAGKSKPRAKPSALDIVASPDSTLEGLNSGLVLQEGASRAGSGQKISRVRVMVEAKDEGHCHDTYFDDIRVTRARSEDYVMALRQTLALSNPYILNPEPRPSPIPEPRQILNSGPLQSRSALATNVGPPRYSTLDRGNAHLKISKASDLHL